jgi:hypothetical protein
MRVSNLKNTSGGDVNVQLVNGATVVLPPGTGLKDTDVSNIESLRGKVKVTQDLTEVSQQTGKTRIYG